MASFTISETILQAYTWIVFMIVFIITTYTSHVVAWTRTNTYLDVAARQEIMIPTTSKMRMIWLNLLYAYAHSFVRILFSFLIICIFCVWVQMCFAFVKNKGSRMKVAAELMDATHVSNALYAQHWLAHVTAFVIYMIVGLLTVNLVNNSSESDFMVKRIHIRAAILSASSLLLFYIFYVTFIIYKTTQ